MCMEYAFKLFLEYISNIMKELASVHWRLCQSDTECIPDDCCWNFYGVFFSHEICM